MDRRPIGFRSDAAGEDLRAGEGHKHGRDTATSLPVAVVAGASDRNTETPYSAEDTHSERRERAVAQVKLALGDVLRGRVDAFACAAGVSPTLVREAASLKHDRRLAIDKLVAAAVEDHALAREVWDAIGRLIDSAAHTAPTPGDIASELRRTSARVGALNAVGDDALADTVVTNKERAALSDAIRRTREQLDQLERAVAGGAA